MSPLWMSGEIYGVTRPCLLTFAEAMAELSMVLGNPMTYQQILNKAFLATVAASGAPKHMLWTLGHLFVTVLDGRKANLAEGVQRSQGQPPKNFARRFSTTQLVTG